ncbi:MAG: biotin--protein ligase [Caulobacteraceae bacterium]|jgi:BirA family biotin operon repressor/biotin-[acetyl-CoA-carboxylase] ligase|nr:biotin--protein ligase [Caulobacteraceae bacterium]
MPETPRILYFDDIDSTNAEARRLAEAGETGPLWITALRQHAGRGRRGRAWETGEGNLAATHLFTTALHPAEAAQVSFVAALAVADLIDAFSRDRASLKWPNDPLIAGRKAAGILVESGALGDGRIWLAVGCGVNLARTPAESERPTAALADHMDGPPPPPREAVLRLAAAMESWRGIWEASGFAPIAEAWTRRAHGLGGPCVAHLSNETVSGVAEGLDTDGALRLRLENGAVRRITAGDVFF